jgi:hypothetical protein
MMTTELAEGENYSLTTLARNLFAPPPLKLVVIVVTRRGLMLALLRT